MISVTAISRMRPGRPPMHFRFKRVVLPQIQLQEVEDAKLFL